jgi:hypothetical protein
MRRLCGLGLACVVLFGLTSQLLARVAGPPPLFVRVALTDTILFGKVKAIEEKETEVTLPGSTDKVSMRVAVVEPVDGLKSSGKVEKRIRVAYFPNSKYGHQPKAGEEGLFYVNGGVSKEGLYVVTGIWDYIPVAAEKDAAEVKRLTRLLANVKGNLQSKDRDDRFLTAAMLVAGYRNRPPGDKHATEAIDAEESKLILTALAEADWTVNPGVGVPQPILVFHMLGLTKADGWVPPQAGTTSETYYKAARDWVKTNAGTYRIQRLVPAK